MKRDCNYIFNFITLLLNWITDITKPVFYHSKLVHSLGSILTHGGKCEEALEE